MDVIPILLALGVAGILIYYFAIKAIDALTDIVEVVGKFADVIKSVLRLNKTKAQNFNIGVDLIAVVFCVGAFCILKDDPVHYRLIIISIAFLIIFTCMWLTFNKG